MANAKPSRLTDVKPEVQDGPIIEHYGDGAKDVQFNIDPKAHRIRVYANGMVVTEYKHK